MIVKISTTLISLAFLLHAICTEVYAEQTNTKIKIGVSTPLSGDASSSGYDIRDALNFANSYFFNNKYELLFEDDRCDGQTANTVARKLISNKKVDFVLGMFCNNALLPVAPVYEKAGVVVITGGANSGDVKGIGKKIFQLYPGDHLAIPPLFNYITQHHKSLGILTQVDAFTDLLERAFIRLNNSSGESLSISIEQANPTSTDFRTQLMRLKAKGVEAIFLNSLAEPGYIDMIKQAKELGITAKLYADLFPASPVSRETLKTLDERVIFSNLPLDLTPEGKNILSQLYSQYGQPRSTAILQPLAIDSLRMLNSAIESGKPVDEYLRKINFPGLIGNISFDSDGAIQGISFRLQTIDQQNIIPLDKEK